MNRDVPRWQVQLLAGILIPIVAFAAVCLVSRLMEKGYSGVSCRYRLRRIDEAMGILAIAEGKARGDQIKLAGLEAIACFELGHRACPQGGHYMVGTIGEPPRCSIGEASAISLAACMHDRRRHRHESIKATPEGDLVFRDWLKVNGSILRGFAVCGFKDVEGASCVKLTQGHLRGLILPLTDLSSNDQHYCTAVARGLLGSALENGLYKR